MNLTDSKPTFDAAFKPGFGTEYSDSYTWNQYYASKEINADIAKPSHALPGDGTKKQLYKPSENMCRCTAQETKSDCCIIPKCDEKGRDPAIFSSDKYPCVYRETRVQKDDRGKYINPFQDLTTLPDGRRLMYDSTHPDLMFASQWSSELADPPGPYSFPAPVDFDAEIPWKKDLQWQVESETGSWPTNLWKEWTKVASCPCYDGHDDQIQYSQYKMPVP